MFGFIRRILNNYLDDGSDEHNAYIEDINLQIKLAEDRLRAFDGVTKKADAVCVDLPRLPEKTVPNKNT